MECLDKGVLGPVNARDGVLQTVTPCPVVDDPEHDATSAEGPSKVAPRPGTAPRPSVTIAAPR